jgi:hypothetical protein
MKTMTLVTFAALLTCLTATPALAQEQNTRTDASYRTEASGTYSMLRDIGENSSMGFLVDFGKQLKPHMSIVGELGVNNFSEFDETYTQFAGGLRIGKATRRVRPFAQVMMGVQHNFGANGFVIQPGGGVNFKVARGMDAKVQLDFPFVQWEGDNYKQFRFSAGIGIPLGRR